MNRLTLILLVFLLSVSAIEATGIQDGYQQKQSLAIDTKTFIYNEEDNEKVTLIGGRSKKFINEHWYVGEAGYAAVAGKRHGYIEGAAFIGHRFQKMGLWQVDMSLHLGAGGGGSDDREGGGLMMEALMELGHPISEDMMLAIHLGYFKFLNGEIESVIWGINVSFDYWVLKG